MGDGSGDGAGGWFASACSGIVSRFCCFSVRKEIGQEEQRNRDEEARLDSARQALSVLMGRQETAWPVVQKRTDAAGDDWGK